MNNQYNSEISEAVVQNLICTTLRDLPTAHVTVAIWYLSHGSVNGH